MQLGCAGSVWSCWRTVRQAVQVLRSGRYKWSTGAVASCDAASRCALQDDAPIPKSQMLRLRTQSLSSFPSNPDRQMMFHFHSSAFVILPMQHAALSGYSDIDTILSVYEISILPRAMPPTVNTTGCPAGSPFTKPCSVPCMSSALCEKPTRSAPAGKYFVTGPFTTCVRPHGHMLATRCDGAVGLVWLSPLRCTEGAPVKCSVSLTLGPDFTACQ